jgi:hypothetical protein
VVAPDNRGEEAEIPKMAERVVRDNTDIVEYKEIKGKFEQENCVVCMEDFKSRDLVRRTHCDHMFHPRCLIQWAKQHYKNQ